MNYAFMSFSTPKMSLTEILETAGEYGYNGIEPRLDAGHAHGIEVTTTPEQRDTFRNQAREKGITLACLATSLSYADPAKVEDMLRQTHVRIDLAGDLGVPVMRLFGGGLPEGLTREAAINQLIESLMSVADHAAQREVTIAMETHDDWCDPEHVAAVISSVNHPFVAVNWDIMHPVRTGLATIDESYDILKPWIRHLHVHDGVTTDGNLKMVPIGSGAIDHRRALQRLVQDGYTGYISGEWINWEAPEVHLPRELAALKAYERELTS